MRTEMKRGDQVQTGPGLSMKPRPQTGIFQGYYEHGQPVIEWDNGMIGTWPEDELIILKPK